MAHVSIRPSPKHAGKENVTPIQQNAIDVLECLGFSPADIMVFPVYA
jgi:hypothetical protein